VVVGPAAWNDLRGVHASARDLSPDFEAEAKRLHLEVVVAAWDRSEGRTKYVRAKKAAMKVALKTLTEELARYDPAFVRRIGFRRILICAGLSKDGSRAWGMAVPETGTLIYNTDAAQGGLSTVRHIIHHEIGHLFDLSSSTPGSADPPWMAANRKGWDYGDRASAWGAGKLDHHDLGLVNSYAAWHPEEDKAEIFGLMLTRSDAVILACANDPHLNEKVRLMDLRVRRIGSPPEGWPSWKRLK